MGEKACLKTAIPCPDGVRVQTSENLSVGICGNKPARRTVSSRYLPYTAEISVKNPTSGPARTRCSVGHRMTGSLISLGLDLQEGR